MKTIFKAFLVLVSMHLYGAKPEIPQWHWSIASPTSVNDKLEVKATLWSGTKATYYNIYANGIKVIDDHKTGASEDSEISDSEDQIIHDVLDISALNPASYSFTIEVCNQDGCSTSGARQVTVGDSSVTAEAATPEEQKQAKESVSDTVSTVEEEELNNATTDADAAIKPATPYVGDLTFGGYSDDFSISWNKWWGNRGHNVKLFINSKLVSTVNLEDDMSSKNSQIGSFDVSFAK
jgi:ATP adenylyltransferase/5',5'''-P-1,P-4-tetraphosphate phosphorylase II